MKPPSPCLRLSGLFSFLFLSVLLATAPAAGPQEPLHPLPVKPLPVKPVLRPAPARPQQPVQQRPQVQQQQQTLQQRQQALQQRQQALQQQRQQALQRQQLLRQQQQQRLQQRQNGQLAGGQGRVLPGQVPAGRGEANPGQNRLGAAGGGGLAAGNVQRGGLRMPPNSRSAPAPGGGTFVAHPDGRRWLLDGNNHVSAFTRPGMEARFYGNGGVNSVHVVRPGNNMFVARAARGDRATLSLRNGGVMVVTFGHDRGFVQRPMPGRQGYFQRTSVVNGQPAARVYRIGSYRGVIYFRPVPAVRYQPQFYQWAGSSWSSPVGYAWSGPQAQAAEAYSNYFTPSSSYSSPSAWLTDYVLSSSLQVAYQNHQEYPPTPGGAAPEQASTQPAPVSPEVKEAITQEVQAEVTQEQAEASQGGAAAANGQAPPPVLDPNQRTVLVSQSLDVPAGTATCALTAGDVVNRSGDNLLPGNKVAVNVVSSKAGDCPANTSTQIDLAVLQEMHNQFQEQIDAGLSTLASSEGSGGLPAGPVANGVPTPDGAAQPDRDVVATLAQQQSEADNAEATATDGANAVGSGGSTTAM